MPSVDDDLAFNRAGRLAPSQAAWLASAGGSWAYRVLGGAASRAAAERMVADATGGVVAAYDGEIRWGALTAAGWSAPQWVGGGPGGQGEALALREGLAALPGPYRLYVAPQSRCVVSVEVVGGRGPLTPDARHVERYRQTLLSLALLDASAVEALRRGVLTPNVALRVLRAGAEWLLVSALGAVFVVGGVALVLGAAGLVDLGGPAPRGSSSGSAALGAALVVAGLAFAYLMGWRPLRRLALDRQDGRVSHVDGHVTKVVRGRGQHKYLRVDDVDHPCGELGDLFVAALEGAHRLYFAPRCGRVVALEPLPAPFPDGPAASRPPL